MLLVSKICAAILLAILRLFAGLIPLKVYRKLEKWAGKQGDAAPCGDPDSIAAHEQQKRRRKRIDLFLSVFLCFGAGLLLSTCFIHMIPEVIIIHDIIDSALTVLLHKPLQKSERELDETRIL